MTNILIGKWSDLWARLTVLSWRKSTTITLSTPQSPLRWRHQDFTIVQNFTHRVRSHVNIISSTAYFISIIFVLADFDWYILKVTALTEQDMRQRDEVSLHVLRIHNIKSERYRGLWWLISSKDTNEYANNTIMWTSRKIF